MLKHFVLSLNPHAQFEWERCTLHNPITAGQPNLAQLVGQVVSQTTGQAGGEVSGSYLVAIDIEVTILEAAAVEQSVNRLIGKLELPTLSVAPSFVDVAA